MEVQALIRQACGEESMKHTGCLNGILSSGHTEKVETGEEQSQEHGQHFQ
jgi:hypothetical protein